MKFQITHSQDTLAHIFVDKYYIGEYDNVKCVYCSSDNT